MKRFWLLALILLLLIAGYVWVATPGHAPAGQPRLVEIHSGTLAALKADFNRLSTSYRVIVLLSPT